MEKKLNLIKTSFKDVFIIDSNYFEDERGEFGRLFCNEELSEILKDKQICQINHSKTNLKGTIRGLHYQLPPFSEIKIIKCLKGKIFDTIIDLRKDSNTFLKSYSFELSSDNNKSLLIPDGFAHGFQTLEDNVEIIYFHTNIYKPNCESALNPFDPMLKIDWPLKTTIVSNKDKNHQFLDKTFRGLQL